MRCGGFKENGEPVKGYGLFVSDLSDLIAGCGEERPETLYGLVQDLVELRRRFRLHRHLAKIANAVDDLKDAIEDAEADS